MTAAFIATQAQTSKDIKWLYPIQINDGSSPTHSYNIPHNKDALIDMESTTKGLLVPRMALVSTALPNPMTVHVKGMHVYDTAQVNDVTPGEYYNDGTQWVRLIAVTDTASNRTAWMTNGNAGTTAGTNFVGTTDVQPLIFKINNSPAGELGFYGQTYFGGCTVDYTKSTGQNNSAFGQFTLQSNNGNYNAAFGEAAMQRNTKGNYTKHILIFAQEAMALRHGKNKDIKYQGRGQLLKKASKAATAVFIRLYSNAATDAKQKHSHETGFVRSIGSERQYGTVMENAVRAGRFAGAAQL